MPPCSATSTQRMRIWNTRKNVQFNIFTEYAQQTHEMVEPDEMEMTCRRILNFPIICVSDAESLFAIVHRRTVLACYNLTVMEKNAHKNYIYRFFVEHVVEKLGPRRVRESRVFLNPNSKLPLTLLEREVMRVERKHLRRNARLKRNLKYVSRLATIDEVACS